MKKVIRWSLLAYLVLVFLTGCTVARSDGSCDEIEQLKTENEELKDTIERLKKVQLVESTSDLKEVVLGRFTVLEKSETTILHPYLLLVQNLKDEYHSSPQTLTVEKDLFEQVEINKEYLFEIGIEIVLNKTSKNEYYHRFMLNGMNIIDEPTPPYPESISEGKIVKGQVIDVVQDEKTGSAYFTSVTGYDWLTDVNEGTARYDSSDFSLWVQVTISEKSCTGAIDGHRVEYTVDLVKGEIINKDIRIFEGCLDDIEEYEFEVSDKQLIEFARDFYTTFKQH